MLRETDINNICKHFSNGIKKSLNLAIGMCQRGLDSERYTHFDNIVEKETHYFLEKKGYRWNNEVGNFDNLNGIDYDNAREIVREALISFLSRTLGINS
ncbi:MAG: hypothetical protein WC584_02770 [Candidatus Pacearchaeota archaeon]